MFNMWFRISMSHFGHGMQNIRLCRNCKVHECTKKRLILVLINLLTLGITIHLITRFQWYRDWFAFIHTIYFQDTTNILRLTQFNLLLGNGWVHTHLGLRVSYETIINVLKKYIYSSRVARKKSVLPNTFHIFRNTGMMLFSQIRRK